MGCDVTGEDRKIPKNLIGNDILRKYNLRYVPAWDHYEYLRDGVWKYIFSDFITRENQITDLIYKAGYNSAVGTIRQEMNKFYKK